jgi:hypothetical protein|tara:strand:+ start:2123 stop:2302 length:180 start_codon:yes stop_codon:yes gene_type:complete
MNDELPRDQTIIDEQEVKQHCSPRCPRCQGVLKTVEIHGHTQCVICKAVVEECCQGQQR